MLVVLRYIAGGRRLPPMTPSGHHQPPCRQRLHPTDYGLVERSSGSPQLLPGVDCNIYFQFSAVWTRRQFGSADPVPRRPGSRGRGSATRELGILLDAFPREKQGIAMTLCGFAVLIGPIVGPTLAGWLTDAYNWRWCFLINVPIGILTFISVCFGSRKRSRLPLYAARVARRRHRLIEFLRNEGGSVGVSLSQTVEERRDQFHVLRLGEYLDPLNAAASSFLARAQAFLVQQNGDPAASHNWLCSSSITCASSRRPLWLFSTPFGWGLC